MWISRDITLEPRPRGFHLVTREVEQAVPELAQLKVGMATVSRNAPLALIATKEVLQKQRDWDADEFWAKQGEITGPVFTSEDAQEGAKAFAEKRDPVWKGR